MTKIEEKLDIKITLFEILHEYEKLSNENKIYELSNHDSDNHAIDLKKDKKSFHESIYFLFENEFRVLRAYIEKHLVNDFIRFSQSSVDAFILFVKKKNDNLRLCVNYRRLNALTTFLNSLFYSKKYECKKRKSKSFNNDLYLATYSTSCSFSTSLISIDDLSNISIRLLNL